MAFRDWEDYAVEAMKKGTIKLPPPTPIKRGG